MSLKKKCIELGIHPSAFNKSMDIAKQIDALQAALATSILDEIALLEDEGLTNKEKKSLFPAIREEFVLSGADIDLPAIPLKN